MTTPRLPLLITVTGPSGTGKDAIIKMVCKKDESIRPFVTCVTRPPRPGEEDGVHYHFWTRERFEEAIKNDEMAEYDEHYGHLYGTPKFELEHHFGLGHHVVSDINIDGVWGLHKMYPERHIAILLLPPSRERLESRLTQRNPELAEEGRKRLAAMGDDFDHFDDPDYIFTNPDMKGSRLADYDKIFVNEDLEVTSFAVLNYIQEEIEKRKE